MRRRLRRRAAIGEPGDGLTPGSPFRPETVAIVHPPLRSLVEGWSQQYPMSFEDRRLL
jgi:hypothetical protein